MLGRSACSFAILTSFGVLPHAGAIDIELQLQQPTLSNEADISASDGRDSILSSVLLAPDDDGTFQVGTTPDGDGPATPTGDRAPSGSATLVGISSPEELCRA